MSSTWRNTTYRTVETIVSNSSSHLTETWRSSLVSSTEQIRFVIVWLYLVPCALKLSFYSMSHAQHSSTEGWSVSTITATHINIFYLDHHLYQSCTSDPSADDRLCGNRCLALTPVLVWWERQRQHVLQWLPDAVQISIIHGSYKQCPSSWNERTHSMRREPHSAKLNTYCTNNSVIQEGNCEQSLS